ILPFTRRKTSQHGASIRLPVGGRMPIGVGRGPLCVPWRASSTTTTSRTLKNRYSSRCMSGNAYAGGSVGPAVRDADRHVGKRPVGREAANPTLDVHLLSQFVRPANDLLVV